MNVLILMHSGTTLPIWLYDNKLETILHFHGQKQLILYHNNLRFYKLNHFNIEKNNLTLR